MTEAMALLGVRSPDEIGPDLIAAARPAPSSPTGANPS